jgi:hypothetical protein
MNRQWITVPVGEDNVVEVIHVVPGRWVEGQPLICGHVLSIECDCIPKILPNLETIISVHRGDC